MGKNSRSAARALIPTQHPTIFNYLREGVAGHNFISKTLKKFKQKTKFYQTLAKENGPTSFSFIIMLAA